MKIILLRHGKPDIPPLEKMTARAFNDWLTVYDTAGLSDTSNPPQHVINMARQCNAVVCSHLPRSIESARSLGIESITLTDPLFNEAELPAAQWPLIKLSPRTWAIIFRIMWLCGYAKNSETCRDAKARAAEAANTLIKLAQDKQNVLVAGHGVFNHLLARSLTAYGWHGPRNPGSGHWQFTVYEYKNQS